MTDIKCVIPTKTDDGDDDDKDGNDKTMTMLAFEGSSRGCRRGGAIDFE